MASRHSNIHLNLAHLLAGLVKPQNLLLNIQTVPNSQETVLVITLTEELVLTRERILLHPFSLSIQGRLLHSLYGMCTQCILCTAVYVWRGANHTVVRYNAQILFHVAYMNSHLYTNAHLGFCNTPIYAFSV